MTLQAPMQSSRPQQGGSTTAAPISSPPPAAVAERPARRPDVELVGEFQGSGYQDRQWLVRRADRFVQLSELLYRITEQATGERTLAEIAARLTESTSWIIAPDQVRQIIATKLIPLGIIGAAEHVAERSTSSPSPLGLNARVRVIGPSVIEPIAAVLQIFFRPVVLLLVLIASLAAHGWVYVVHGVSNSFEQVIYTPWLIVVQLALVCASGMLHEFGHAAALRYSGGKVRGMGVGFYLIYPALYTDVTDSYRLPRSGRVRTDLGGVYFNLLFVLATLGAYVATRQEFLLLTVVLVDLDLVRQLLPLGRLDGYWVLTDMTGVPDAFSQLLRSAQTAAARVTGSASRAPRLKRWVTITLLLYALAIVPLLALLFVLTAAGLPTFLLFSWDSFGMQLQTLLGAMHEQNVSSIVGAAAQIGILAVMVLGPLVLLYTMSASYLRGLWTWSVDRPARRAMAVLGVCGAIALLATQWAPQLTPLWGVAEPENAPQGVQVFDVKQRLHVESAVSYPQSPPVGGNHAPVWQNCGFYSTPVANENVVHSLEHGAVWIAYQPDLPSAQLQLLRDLAAQPHSSLVVSPYPGLDAPLVATAWGRQLRLASVDDARLQEFVRAYRGGPQAPERGAPCSGGVGEPAT